MLNSYEEEQIIIKEFQKYCSYCGKKIKKFIKKDHNTGDTKYDKNTGEKLSSYYIILKCPNKGRIFNSYKHTDETKINSFQENELVDYKRNQITNKLVR